MITWMRIYNIENGDYDFRRMFSDETIIETREWLKKSKTHKEDGVGSLSSLILEIEDEIDFINANGFDERNIDFITPTNTVF